MSEAAAMYFLFPPAEGSNTTNPPRATASEASFSVAGDNRSRKNADASARDCLAVSTASSVLGLNVGSEAPQRGHSQENLCWGRPSTPRPLDLLHDDRSVCSRATGPVEPDHSMLHLATDALRRIVTVQSRYRENIPVEVRQNRERTPAGSAGPCGPIREAIEYNV